MSNFLSGIPIIGGLLGGSGPSYTATPLDAGTTGLMNQDVNQVANQSPGQISAATNQAGTNASKSFGGGAPGTQNAAGTGTDPNMLQAIKNQYSGMASKDLDSLQRQNQSQAQVEKGQQMSEFAKTALAQQQVMTQNYTDLMNAQNQNTMARAGMITSLLNLGTQGIAIGAAGGKVQPGINVNSSNNMWGAPGMGGAQGAAAMDNYGMGGG